MIKRMYDQIPWSVDPPSTEGIYLATIGPQDAEDPEVALVEVTLYRGTLMVDFPRFYTFLPLSHVAEEFQVTAWSPSVNFNQPHH